MENVWTNDLVLEFIFLYESYPVLWDAKHKNHKNRNSLFDAWKNIATELNMDVTVDELRKKKESLMSTYRTLAKKVRDSHTTGPGAKDVYVPTWFAFDAIDRFIGATAKKIPSLNSEEAQNEQLLGDEISQNEEDPLMNDMENVGQDHSDPLAHETSQDRDFVLPQGAPKKRGRSPSQVESNVTKHLQHTSDVLTSLTTKSQARQMETSQDAFALYGQLLAVKLRRLSKRTQLILQNKIDNLVFEAELNEIDLNVPSLINSNNFYSSASPTPSPTISQVSSSRTSVLLPESFNNTDSTFYRCNKFEK